MAGFVAGIAMAANLPRLDALVQGDMASTVGPWDASWQLAQLTAVAHGSIPPQHYFFPEASLHYYYWSWIYPALLANQPLVRIPLARALSLASMVQTAAFLGVAYWLIRLNFRTLFARLTGLGFLTIMGGYDFFASMGTSLTDREWWQTAVSWLAGGFQVSSAITLYAWAPQHVAGAMAFVLLVILYKHSLASSMVRAAIAGVLLSFTLGTSAPIFLGSSIAALVWVLVSRVKWSRRRLLYPAILLLAIFLVGSWRQILLSLGSSVSLVWSSFRVPLLETFYGTRSPKVVAFDRGLTLLALPAVAP